MQRRYRLSRRRACAVPAVAQSTHRYEGERDPQDELRGRLKELAGAEAHYGYRRLYVLLRREGREVNKKRVYRLYSEEGLTMRREAPRRSASSQIRSERPAVEGMNRARAMDFMSDTLSDGRRIRVLTVMDVFTREGLALRADFRFTPDQVVAVLSGPAAGRGAPQGIRVDNGPEFTGRSLDLWAYFNEVTLDFSRPGEPTDSAFIEAFNARVRQECLNRPWFLCLEDARAKIETWRRESNEERPHGALGDPPPGEFAATEAGGNRPRL